MQVKQRAEAGPAPAPATAEKWVHEPRIKAAAIAAPAIGYAFTKDGLADVTAPTQLWRAEKDWIAPNEWNGDFVKASLPKLPDDHPVPGAGHFAFLAPCSDALAAIAHDIRQDAAGFDRAAFHKELNQALIDFFKAKLSPP